jgi:hypothetical protein
MTVRSLIAVLTAAAVVTCAAPADAARRGSHPPTRLWYGVKVIVEWNHVWDEVHPDTPGVGRTDTSHILWEAHTTPGEAILLRYDRSTHNIGFAGAIGGSAVGRLILTDWQNVIRWDGETIPSCNGSSVTTEAHLSRNPQLAGLVSVSGGVLVQRLSTLAKSNTTDVTAPIDCTGHCPPRLPLTPRSPIDTGGGNCRFDSGGTFEGDAQWELFHYAHDPQLPNRLAAAHHYTLNGHFGDRIERVTSTARADARINRSMPTVLGTENVLETIILDFTRCPHAGRRPC